MMEQCYKKFHGHMGRLPHKQKGALTMFSAVLILILLTELIIYAVQIGVFEQRKSANEMRQKEAFHIAESAIQFSKEYLLANSRNLSGDTWLANRWKKCSDLNLPDDGTGTHPCYAEPADGGSGFPTDLRNNMYYYFPDSADDRGTPDAFGNPTLPIDIAGVIPDGTQRVSVYALLCMLHIERDPGARTLPNSPVQGCTMEADLQDPVYFMVTLMARGEADCDGGTCSARALITDKVGSFGPIAGEGGPGVPLTTKSTFPPSGTSEIVPNPNGGGVGVPISAWMNSNDSCPNLIPVDPTGGSWSTCERHEWYGTDTMPDNYQCPTANCSCGTDEKRLSYSENANNPIMGIDLVADEGFPCDLWWYMFGIRKYEQPEADPPVVDKVNVAYVRDFLADEIVQAGDCDNLDTITTPDADGNYPRIIWIEGGNCNFTGNKEIGSPDAPVFLISAANTFKATGTVNVFGTLFVTDVLDSEATLDAHGTMTIYGAAVIDGKLGHYTGTFQLVYVDDIIKVSLESGKFGNASGGWSDFHQDWR